MAANPVVLDFQARVGLIFVVEAACLSALAVTMQLCYFAYTSLPGSNSKRTWRPTTSLHFYLLNLLISDLIQSISGIINAAWIPEALVYNETTCIAQSFIKQVGDIGIALTSLIIAFHTFAILVLRWTSPLISALYVLIGIWSIISGTVSITLLTGGDSLANVQEQYWCRLNADYGQIRMMFEYIYPLISVVVNIGCYVTVALVLKGFLMFERNRFRVISRSSRIISARLRSKTAAEKKVQKSAKRMLLYPGLYTLTVAPITIVRWLSFFGTKVPFSAHVGASILFYLSGLFDVLLYRYTRPGLMPSRRMVPSKSSTEDTKMLLATSPLSLEVESPRFPTSPQIGIAVRRPFPPLPVLLEPLRPGERYDLTRNNDQKSKG